MRDHWKDIVAVHNPTEFSNIGLKIEGIEHFSDRALVLPARAAVVQRGIDPAYVNWLRSPGVRLGPKKIIEVDGPNLFDGLTADADAMRSVEAELRAGARLQPFVMTTETQMFFRVHGINRGEWHGAPLEVSRQMNDKAEFRRIVDKIGLKHMLLPYASTRRPEIVRRHVEEFLRRFPRVVVKRTNLAGGDGMCYIRKGEDYEERLDAFLEQYRSNTIRIRALRKEADGSRTMVEEVEARDKAAAIDAVMAFLARPATEVAETEVWRYDVLGTASMVVSDSPHAATLVDSYLTRHQENDFLIEPAIKHQPYSTQLVIDDQKSFDLVGVTRQYVDDEGRHFGNAMSRFPHPERMPREDLLKMKEATLAVARWARDQMGRDPYMLGLDFLKEADSEQGKGIYFAECNGRQTASTYPFGVSWQLESRHHEAVVIDGAHQRDNWGIVMYNAARTKARSFDELASLIGADLLFEGASGVIPFNIRLMQNKEPRSGFIAVGRTIEEAEAMSADTLKRFRG